MKPTIELNKEQFMDRIERELNFNEAAMNMVDKLWDDMEGKSVSLTSRDGIDAYYPAFFEEFLELVYGDDYKNDDVVDIIKECSNYDEIKGNNVNEKIKENSLFYDYPDGTEESKDGPWKVADIREWLKEEDKLNSEDAWRVERRGGKDIDEFWDGCTAEELVEYWLEDRGDGGCKIEFIDTPHIPNDQDLSVEEINAYLKKENIMIEYTPKENKIWPYAVVRDINNYKKLDFKKYYDKKLNFDDVVLYQLSELTWMTCFSDSKLLNITKQGLFNLLTELSSIFVTETYIKDTMFGYIPCSRDVATEVGLRYQKRIDSLVNNFDEKFDKCMAEFHAKDRQNPNEVAKEAKDVARGGSGKCVGRDIEER